ncbi:MAG: SpoIIE family protein phosphatase, partial [Bacteroidales bacterium]|nr:SpoIIE family protein phosphatase [Bacteroidales bacterium]
MEKPKRVRRCIICFLTLQLLPLILIAQQSYLPKYHSPLLDKWRITHIEELEDKSISGMGVSNDGAMFFTGNKSFYQYDGYNWENLLPDSVLKGRNDAYNEIIHAKDGGVYLLQQREVNYYKDGKLKTLLSNTDVKPNFIYTDILLLSNDNILVSTILGLFYFTPEQNYYYGHKDKLEVMKKGYPDYQVLPLPGEFIKKGFQSLYACVEKNENEIWVFGANKGILKISYSEDSTNPFIFSMSDDNVKASNHANQLKTKSGDIWIGSEAASTAVYRYTDNKWIEYWPSKMFGVNNKTSQIIEASDGAILIGGVGYLIVIKDDNAEMYTREHLPLPDQVIKLKKDKNDNIWLGSLGGKYYVIDYTSVRWSRFEDLIYQFESNDSIWFISKDNKAVVNYRNHWFCYDESNGLMDAPVKLVKNTKGHVWCAGSHKGVAATAFLRNGKWEKQVHERLGWGIHKKSVYEDFGNNLWFGAVQFHKGFGGAMRLSYEELSALNWQHVRITGNKTGGANELIGGITESEDSTIYFGTFYKIHNLKKGDKKVKPSKIDYVGPVQHIKTYDKKHIWVGTKRHGVINWSKDERKNYGIGNGLLSNFIIALHLENQNRLWVATDEDISYFNGQTWTNNCMPEELIFKSVSSEITGNSEKNEIWVSMIPKEWALRASTSVNGYGELFSVRYVRDTNPPETQITHYDTEVDQSGNTYIAWSAIDYWNATGKDDLMFSYKLNDEDWTEFNYEKGKSFSGLSDGHYKLQVRAKDKEFNIDRTPAVAEFRVLPPVYKRKWFIIMISIFVLVTIILIVNIVVRNKKLAFANIDLKEKQDEIMQQNEEIQQQNEEILTINEKLEDQKKEISHSYKRLEVLSEFGQKITTTLSISSINDMIYHYVKSILHVDAFGIGLHNPQENIIVYPVFYKGDQKREEVKNLDDDNSLTAWCFNNQKAVFINNFEEEYGNYLDIRLENTSEEEAKSRIHLPLTVENKRIGIIVINSSNNNEYSKEDFTNFQTLASYISIALDNAKAYEMINDINQSVKESITYAKSIQTAFLPTREELSKYFNTEILFKPKDIVSGDFYWFTSLNSGRDEPLKAFLCVADCTGHGVPGALISSIGNNLLNEVIVTKKIHDPANVLEMVNDGFQQALNQKETGNNDGMDMALVLIEAVGSLPDSEAGDSSSSQSSIVNHQYKITFAGAKNPLVIYREKTGELEYIKGSRKSIGGMRAWRSRINFENFETTVSKEDVVYLFTDGILDQHSEKRERYTRERL